MTYLGVKTKVTDVGTRLYKLLQHDLYVLSLEIGRFVIMMCVCETDKDTDAGRSRDREQADSHKEVPFLYLNQQGEEARDEVTE